MTNRACEYPIEAWLLAVGDMPDHRALPGDRPSQEAVLAKTGMFDEIPVASLSDVQVECTAVAVRELPVVAVEFADVPHGNHIDRTLVLTTEYAPGSRDTIMFCCAASRASRA